MADIDQRLHDIVHKALLDMACVQCTEEEFEAGLEHAIREMQRLLNQAREAKRFRHPPRGHE